MPDPISADTWSQAIQAFYFSYRAFTAKPDEILARRGLSRVHHRILFFVARQPQLSVKELLATLDVTKQALNIPLRQLQEMQLIRSEPSVEDKRKRLLSLTAEGVRLERALSAEQARLLQRAFAEAGEDAVHGWLAVSQALAHATQEG
ncbi:MarR family winged helix-turn-helix transcriptional regulator [Pseudomonas citronellolis]|uniref:MarR family winged helix-turn-helix transcriptional regulator n=1 Tax=Pseudomonas citronellolis TaxID=53408 RepID=UPI0023E3DFD7|nr:MarR family transcriptional regulator [Pseudomonas citronellolis]MDF3934517.1 MarR family transcriptional regulator [Pseudomonas citronellolis]